MNQRPPERQFTYTAWFSFKGDEYLKHFDNYFEAIERCSIRFESVGTRKEHFAGVKVERAGAVVWEMPETLSRKSNPLGFADFTVR